MFQQFNSKLPVEIWSCCHNFCFARNAAVENSEQMETFLEILNIFDRSGKFQREIMDSCVSSRPIGVANGSKQQRRKRKGTYVLLEAMNDSTILQGGRKAKLTEKLHGYCIIKLPFLRGVKDDRICLLYTSPSPRDLSTSRMPSSA